MRIERIAADARVIAQAAEFLRLGDGLGVVRDADGVAKLLSGAWVEIRGDAATEIDGTTDNTADFDEAEDYLTSLGGGILLHREGTAVVTQLRRRSKVGLIGSGWGSIIKQKADSHTVFDSGTSTGSNTSTTLNDTTKSFPGSNGLSGKTLWVGGGTGAGQFREIVSNTATQAVIDDAWTVTPDATSTYQILTPLPLLVLDDANVEQTMLQNITLDGNKANQKALNPGIRWTHAGGSWETNDQHHLIDRVRVKHTKGHGLETQSGTREARFSNVFILEPDLYGFYLNDSDGRFAACTVEKAGKSGYYLGGANDLLTMCKAFGCGQRQLTGNGQGFFVAGDNNVLLAPEAQENWQRGFYLLNCEGNQISAAVADSNDAEAFLFDGATKNKVDGVVTSAAHLLYNHTYGADWVNGAIANMVTIRSAGVAPTTSVVNEASVDSNFVYVDGISKPVQSNFWGTVASAHNEHYRFGKKNAPASGSPYWTFKTTDDATPDATLESYDGSTTSRYFTFNHAQGSVRVGGTDPGGTDLLRVGGAVRALAGKFQGTDTGAIPLFVQIPAGQTAALARFNDSAANALFTFTPAGSFRAASNGWFQGHDAGGQTGLGMEIGITGGTIGFVQAINYTTSAYAQMNFYGNSFVFVDDATPIAVVDSTAIYPFTTAVMDAGATSNKFRDGWFSRDVHIAGHVKPALVDVTTTSEALRYGKSGAPASNNPYFTWKHDNATPPLGLFESYDGTNTRQWIRADVGNGILTLADGFPRRVEIGGGLRPSTLYSTGDIGASTQRWGTAYFSDRVDVVTANEGIRFGASGSPAGGNPYYVLKLGALEGWDGTTSATFLSFSHSNNSVDVGGSNGKLSFLGGTPVTRRDVLSSDGPTTATLLNRLLAALAAYNLIANT